MEISVSEKNYEELNRIRVGIIEAYLETKVEFSSYDKIGTDSQLLVIDIDGEISEIEKKTIMKLIEKIQYCCKFLYKGYELPIKQLKSMNREYLKIMNYKDVYYYNTENFTEELEEFSHIFVRKFRDNYQHIKINHKQAESVLGLENIGLLPCKLHNSNGRIYLEIDGDKHIMDYEKLSNHLVKHMKDSDLEPHYKLESNIDSINVHNLMKGKSPISAYYPSESSSHHTFKLTMAFAKLCKKDNLPMLNCRDIASFSQSILGFEYYSINNVIKLKDMYESLHFENFKEHEFNYLENALAFCIYLSGFGIKHLILSNSTLNKYNVCYVYETLLDPYINIDDMKQRIIDSYTTVHMTDRDPVDNKKFKHMSIQELLSCSIVRDYLVFDKHSIQHVNPYDNEGLPLSYYETKNYQKYSIYNIGNIIKGIFKRPPMYDRSDLQLRDVEISIEDGHITIYGTKLSTDMFFSNNDRALRHIHKIWKKGHFLNSFGLMYYLETGEFAKQTIIIPEWFTFKNSNEHKFYKFLKFNDL